MTFELVIQLSKVVLPSSPMYLRDSIIYFLSAIIISVFINSVGRALPPGNAPTVIPATTAVAFTKSRRVNSVISPSLFIFALTPLRLLRPSLEKNQS